MQDDRYNIWGNKRYQNWRNAVFERDNYECKKCGTKEKLHAHHIESYCRSIKKRFEIENGLTLCSSCHARMENTGRKASLQTRLKMSRSHQGRKWSDESKRKLSESKKGNIIPQEIRDKISKKLMGNIPWSKGKKFTEEHKEKLRKAKIGHIPWNKGKKKIK